MASLLDPIGAGWYHRLVAENMFRSFWAQFAWGHIQVAPFWYGALLVVMMLGVVGSLIALWRKRCDIDWAVIAVMGIALVAVWTAGAMRGISVSLEANLWLPSARYGFPAIIPALLLLNVGWLESERGGSNILRRFASITPQQMQLLNAVVYVSLFVLIDVISLLTLIHSYRD